MKWIAILSPALLLGGCTLHSPMPLIAATDHPETAVPGDYTVYLATDAKGRRRLPKPKRAECLDPGYFARDKDAQGKPQGKPERIYYCAYDPDQKKDLPTIALFVEDGEYRMVGPEGEGVVRFRGWRGPLYLTQIDESRGDKPKFGYHFFRAASAGFEIFPLYCTYFPSFWKAPAEGTEEVPKGCEISSLEPVRAELDAAAGLVESGTDIPLLILRRKGGAR
ncbi:hypothetical protein ACFQ1E_14690 [Sphingomonas canadensis]|uniref:Lipoprotein n=1 Tax=Sphingomonas canadensis TaxID=1219257 RepID=A0ABW3H984_9SPHN|nr:hypothetical protein [Sphingomonas canadensis]MCW3837168.1 hypothetical protein [Sphingomonas canadensis]